MNKILLVLFLGFQAFIFTQETPVVIPLGSSCHISTEMRCHNIRDQAFPFDWNITTFDSLYRILDEDFAHFLDQNYLTLREDRYSVINTYYGIEFRHDFPNDNPKINKHQQLDIPPHEMAEFKIATDYLDFLESVNEKYQRRIQRFYEVASSSQQVIFIRYGLTTKEEAIQLQELLHRKFPALNFILVICGEGEGIKSDWQIPGIKNFYARPVKEDWTKIFTELKLI
jgi:hypothetical protein